MIWRRRRRGCVTSLLILVVILVVFLVATVRLFVLPARNSPRHVDAVIVLAGDGHRLTLGIKLVRQGYASTLVISAPSGNCVGAIKGVRIICFDPQPSTTQGEARFTAKAVRHYGWKHLIVVSSTDQTTRARLRFQRCTKIDIAYVPAATPNWQWPYRIAYEWTALVKALVLQRGC